MLSDDEVGLIGNVEQHQLREELFLQAAKVAWRNRSFVQWDRLIAELTNASSPRVRALANELIERRQILESRRASF